MLRKALDHIEKKYLRKDLPEFRTGDTVRVHTKIKEGDKERIQIFEGVVMAHQPATRAQANTAVFSSGGTPRRYSTGAAYKSKFGYSPFSRFMINSSREQISTQRGSPKRSLSCQANSRITGTRAHYQRQLQLAIRRAQTDTANGVLSTLFHQPEVNLIAANMNRLYLIVTSCLAD